MLLTIIVPCRSSRTSSCRCGVNTSFMYHSLFCYRDAKPHDDEKAKLVSRLSLADEITPSENEPIADSSPAIFFAVLFISHLLQYCISCFSCSRRPRNSSSPRCKRRRSATRARRRVSAARSAFTEHPTWTACAWFASTSTTALHILIKDVTFRR